MPTYPSHPPSDPIRLCCGIVRLLSRIACEDPRTFTLDGAMGSTPEKLLLASPRGYCAGVDRAVQTVERALNLYGAPVYVRKEIVHNKHVVQELREKGAIFVESETEIPEHATAVLSASRNFISRSSLVALKYASETRCL